mmetsp:Transcript_90667/g.234110  ORF Transcript_90667/g.234110 Transcript_90667/m.234110 type:complete len:161 (+) Transcript_90667:155-637(+)
MDFNWGDDSMPDMPDGFEDIMRDVKKSMKQEEAKKSQAKEPRPQQQFSEAQSKALLAELTPKLREELCHVLRAQSGDGPPPGERPAISPELSRILNRFQRRCGMGPGGRGETGDEIWPMYLGIALFVLISILCTVIWLQDAYAEQDTSDQDDFYWLLREF